MLNNNVAMYTPKDYIKSHKDAKNLKDNDGTYDVKDDSREASSVMAFFGP
jgi:hypothetical protein